MKVILPLYLVMLYAVFGVSMAELDNESTLITYMPEDIVEIGPAITNISKRDVGIIMSVRILYKSSFLT